jgi:hypothetical protein
LFFSYITTIHQDGTAMEKKAKKHITVCRAYGENKSRKNIPTEEIGFFL